MTKKDKTWSESLKEERDGKTATGGWPSQQDCIDQARSVALQNETLKAENEALKTRVHELEKELRETHDQINELGNTNKALVLEVDELGEEKRRLEGDCAELREKAAAVIDISENWRWRGRRARLRRAISALKGVRLAGEFEGARRKS